MTAYSGCDCRPLSAWNFPPTFPFNPGQRLTISTFVFIFNLRYYNHRLLCKLFVHPQLAGEEGYHYRCRRST